jgi:hypothetical protein
MWVTSGTAAQLPIDYRIGEDFVIPSEAWVTVRDHTGEVLISEEPLGVTSTSTSFEVPDPHNVLPNNGVFVFRYVTVIFNYENRQHQLNLTYRIMAFAPLAVTAQNVRDELGLDASELPDTAIDIPMAYLHLVKDYGADFEAALISDDLKALQAQKAVGIRAAMETVNSLTFRAGVKFTAEESQFTRQSTFDQKAISYGLSQRLQVLLDEILEREPVGNTVTLVIATPTDAITGE